MYINGVKYACSTCIKGHRSSHCSHVDRPLFEIRKKGRPVTQCSYCRDLRKTKQVHVKCACIDKKGEQQPILIYRNQQQGCTQSDTCKDQCACPPKVASSEQVNLTPNVTQNTSTAEPTLLAPLCATTSVENSSYSWALITSSPHLSSNLSVASTTSDFSVPQDTKTPPPYDEGVHLGFTFHKSSSQRFLDGQPRERRKRSTHQKHRNSTSSSCSTSSCTRPVTSVPPVVAASIDTNASMYLGLTTPPPASISPPSGTETMDFQFDYVSDQLNAFLANPSPPDDLVNTEELTAILNEVLQSGPQEVYSFKESPPPPPLMPPPIVKSECGSFSDKCCQRNGPTESVVITITPLTEPFVKSSDQQPTTTRIVSCHCGAQCKCPGCLVHPSNSALFQNDPYTSNISSSSSCYGSDDELNTFAFTNTAF